MVAFEVFGVFGLGGVKKPGFLRISGFGGPTIELHLRERKRGFGDSRFRGEGVKYLGKILNILPPPLETVNRQNPSFAPSNSTLMVPQTLKFRESQLFNTPKTKNPECTLLTLIFTSTHPSGRRRYRRPQDVHRQTDADQVLRHRQGVLLVRLQRHRRHPHSDPGRHRCRSSTFPHSSSRQGPPTHHYIQ